jgi:hypothetical protein
MNDNTADKPKFAERGPWRGGRMFGTPYVVRLPIFTLAR